MKFLRRLACLILLLGFSFFAASLATFSVLDTFPASLKYLNLQKIKYFALREKYVSDPSLIFVHRDRRVIKTRHHGDLYVPSIGVESPQIPFEASYNDLGFRRNSSHAPFQIAVIGDSFIEAGETDSDTLSERIHALSGLSAFNLGRAWYGPYQYVELLKRYVLQLKPKHVFFCFFSGNDISDIKQYKIWTSGKPYYFFRDPLERSFFIRFVTALFDTYDFAAKALKRKGRPPLDLANIQLGDKNVRMRFGNWDAPDNVEQLLASDEWQTLKNLLAEFKQISAEHGIDPVVVYIPSKIEVYALYYTEGSEPGFLKKVDTQLKFDTNKMEALVRLTTDLELKTINLLPYFRQLAREGRLLYYPFDSHWNSEGRQAAAEIIGRSMKWIPQQ